MILSKSNTSASTTASSLAMDRSNRSNIVRFYHNRSILITGASGFVGKVLIEKLLRDCPGIRHIFVLIRPKRKIQPHERLQKLLEEPLFDQVRQQQLLQKVVVVEGDVTEANLGLGEQNLARVMNEVSVICHSAATVKFDEPLKQSIGINLEGTRNLIELCRKMPQLAAMVHVSTAYANCDREEVGEHVYPIELDPERLIDLAGWMDQETLQELKHRLLAKRPNTYTFTKALTEWWLVKHARDLPVVICRPSIVGASWREPFAGWVDNMNGPTGIILGTGKGLMRTMYGRPECVADLVPVDTVINMIIALGWFASTYRQHRLEAEEDEDNANNNNNNICNNNNNNNCKNINNNNSDYIYHGDDGYASANPSPAASSDDDLDEKEQGAFEYKLKQFRRNLQVNLRKSDLDEELADIPVFHCTTGPYNPITWARVQVIIMAMLATYPSITTYRCPSGSFTDNKRLDYFYRMILHYFPAYIVDTIQNLRGHKSNLVRIYEKIDQAADVLSTFTTRGWQFRNDNSKMFISELMSADDRRIFNCDLSSLDWQDYLRDYVLGARKFMLKEPITNLDVARRNLKKVYYRNMSLQVVGAGLVGLIVTWMGKFLYSCW